MIADIFISKELNVFVLSAVIISNLISIAASIYDFLYFDISAYFIAGAHFIKTFVIGCCKGRECPLAGI